MPKSREELKLFFEKNLNEIFTIIANEEKLVEIELIEVNDGRQMDELNITSFSLLFQSELLDYRLPEQLYQISKGEDFKEVLFISSKQPNKVNSFFEVIYN